MVHWYSVVARIR